MAASGSNQSQDADHASVSLSQSDKRSKGRRQILIVEDNQADLYLIQEAIAAVNIAVNVQVLRDGGEATRYFDLVDRDDNTPRPDLILLDLNLPKKNGEEVLQHLRNGRRCKDARVLIITSSDSPRDRRLAIDLGAAAYFRKPSDYEEFMKLGALVEKLLEDEPDDAGPAL